MLNINNIDSDFNKRNLHVTDIAKILGQPYTTVVNKKKRGNWSPNDVEMFADYFNRSILYYFDRDEKPYKIPNTEVDVANDGGDCCRRCKDLEKQILLLEKMVAMYENPPKKETSDANSTQFGEGAKGNKASGF